ncbi:MAG: flagellar basal body rod protein FlgC [Phycisphaerales bacterium]
MYGLLDISTSGMVAQRTRLTAISANIANRHSVDAQGNPYRAKMVFFSAGDKSAATAEGRKYGVQVSHIEDDPTPFQLKWDPAHPRAIKEGPQAGYVQESNVNPVMEQVNAVQAARAYEANAVAAEATKQMIQQALRLLG